MLDFIKILRHQMLEIVNQIIWHETLEMNKTLSHYMFVIYQAG